MVHYQESLISTDECEGVLLRWNLDYRERWVGCGLPRTVGQNECRMTRMLSELCLTTSGVDARNECKFIKNIFFEK